MDWSLRLEVSSLRGAFFAVASDCLFSSRGIGFFFFIHSRHVNCVCVIRVFVSAHPASLKRQSLAIAKKRLTSVFLHLLNVTTRLSRANKLCTAFFGFLDSENWPCALWTRLRDRLVPQGIFAIWITIAREKDFAAA